MSINTSEDFELRASIDQTTKQSPGRPKLKKVFIVGFPRSGTTWTMWLLAQHPAVVACQHAGVFHALAPLSDWWKKGERFGKRVVGLSGDDDSNYIGTALNEILSPEEFYGFSRSLAQNVFDKIASCKPGVEVLVEQTPENLDLSDLILNIFPDAYFLHVIRDPRSIVCSLRSAVLSWASPGGFPTSPAEGAKAWCSYIEKGNQIARLTSRYTEVRYETLLAEGHGELERIFSWLGLPSDPSFCKHAVDAVTIEKLREQTVAPEGFFRKGKVAGWHEELSASALRTIEYVAGDVMEQLGYVRALKSLRHRPFRLWLRECVANGLRRFYRLRRLRRFVRTMKGMAS